MDDPPVGQPSLLSINQWLVLSDILSTAVDMDFKRLRPLLDLTDERACFNHLWEETMIEATL